MVREKLLSYVIVLVTLLFILMELFRYYVIDAPTPYSTTKFNQEKQEAK